MQHNRTVLRATQILMLLSQRRDGMTVSEVSAALSLPQPSVHNIMTTLNQTHFLRRSGKRYTVGYAVSEVAEAYDQSRDLLSIANRHLQKAAEACMMTGALVLLRGIELNYVVEYRPKGSIVAPGSGLGGNIMHAAASGKIFLAFSASGKRQKLLRDIAYERFTAKTLCSEDALLKDLDTVRSRGYAVDDGEYHDMLTCVSAPVLLKKNPIAAVTLSGLNIPPERVSFLGNHVRELAATIVRDLEMEYPSE